MPDPKYPVNLPKTDFPMKADLPTREPQILARWNSIHLYERMRARGRGRPRFVLHDGPPYANGPIHMGHALNKVLKDIIVKYKGMAGHDAPYVPGWDCHGLPIEYALLKELGKQARDVDRVDFRARARDYAMKFVALQRGEFERLGVTGDWTHPYLTMDPKYEAEILRVLGRLAAGGFVYRGRKPITWCGTCETALAEAEVEYEEKESPSVYVAFGGPPGAPAFGASAVIWTTTPWTLPANVALAFHPREMYVTVRWRGREFLVAEKRMPRLEFLKGADIVKNAARFPGTAFHGVRFRNHLTGAESVAVAAEFVSMDDGTGIVHIAPGHGAEDFQVGRAHGLDVRSPVDAQGRFTETEWKGRRVFEANPDIIKTLHDREALLESGRTTHSYPHCWRCKQPLITRATDQWFLNVEQGGLRARLVTKATQDVRWIPPAGRQRIVSMLETRPDWCLSRQRHWGTPIPAVHCRACGEAILDPVIVERVASQVEKDGSDVWFARSNETFLPDGYACRSCGKREFIKEEDILDVWFDSGVSWQAVLRARESELGFPADLYLEGSDQHRGWFQVSLIPAAALEDRPPFRAVLTHGFVLDGEGRAMSKSRGNVISPQEIIGKYGADILRLWVAAEDYREDIRLSDATLRQMAEGYRRVRNTMRFLLGNLADLPENVKCQPLTPSMQEIDRWAMHRLQMVVGEVGAAYEAFEFHRAWRAIHQFCAVDLSAFYFDVLKDRLYTSRADDPARRAAQAVLDQIFQALVRLLAPILPFTAEEAWGYRPEEGAESPLLAEFPSSDPAWTDRALGERWDRILEIRGEVWQAVEQARREQGLGGSLEARVILRGAVPAADWPALLIVSEVEIASAGPGPVTVEKARGRKCARCWRWTVDVGRAAEHPDLCARCAEVVRA